MKSASCKRDSDAPLPEAMRALLAEMPRLAPHRSAEVEGKPFVAGARVTGGPALAAPVPVRRK